MIERRAIVVASRANRCVVILHISVDSIRDDGSFVHYICVTLHVAESYASHVEHQYGNLF